MVTVEQVAQQIIHATGGDTKRVKEAAEIIKAQLGPCVAALAIHADRYQREFGLDGLHPTHYDTLKDWGFRMDDFKRAQI